MFMLILGFSHFLIRFICGAWRTEISNGEKNAKMPVISAKCGGSGAFQIITIWNVNLQWFD